MSKSFEDTSIFHNIAQYVDDNGVQWRRENDDAIFMFYKKIGSAFLLEGSIWRMFVKAKSVRGIHEAFLKHHEKNCGQQQKLFTAEQAAQKMYFLGKIA